MLVYARARARTGTRPPDPQAMSSPTRVVPLRDRPGSSTDAAPAPPVVVSTTSSTPINAPPPPLPPPQPLVRPCGWEMQMRAGVVLVIIIFAVSLGGGLPCHLSLGAAACSCSSAVTAASAIIGWGYFACWSASFWPQTILNWKRKSVVGLSFDFVVLNEVGFLCYALFNCVLFFNAAAKRDYAASHGGEASGVRANDVFFALHACLVTLIQLAQIALYERGGQRISRACKLALVAIALLAVGLAVPVGVHARGCGWLNRVLALHYTEDPSRDGACSTLTLLYALSYVKLAITLVKYMPQLYLNWQRRSTVGWNIDNVLLDFMGGLLSLLQLLLDAGCSGQWSQLVGDPVKFGLGFSSMFFDTLFMVQHFVLYPERRRRGGGGGGSDGGGGGGGGSGGEGGGGPPGGDGLGGGSSSLRERLLFGEPSSATAPATPPGKERALSGLLEPE